MRIIRNRNFFKLLSGPLAFGSTTLGAKALVLRVVELKQIVPNFEKSAEMIRAVQDGSRVMAIMLERSGDELVVRRQVR